MRDLLKLAASLTLLASAAAWGQVGPLRIAVPAFSGQDAIGKNVASVLMLQVFTALRVPPASSGASGQRQNAVVLWHPNPLASEGHEGAIAQMAPVPVMADIILWGKAYALDAAVVVQAHFTMPAAGTSKRVPNELWRVEVPTRSGVLGLRADIPSRRYSFDAFSLPSDLVNRYREPGLLQIRSVPTGNGMALGTLGDNFIALESDASAVKVRAAGGVVGWVSLPQLSSVRSDIIDFTNGVVRLLRADWRGAADIFEKLAAGPGTRPEIRRDSRLLIGLCTEKQGHSAQSQFEELRRQFPLSQAATTYLVMSRMSELSRAMRNSDARASEALARELEVVLNDVDYLYAPDDAWMTQARLIVRAVR